MTNLLEKKIYTYEDIKSLPEGNYEIIDGERRDITPTKFYHGDLEGTLDEFELTDGLVVKLKEII